MKQHTWQYLALIILLVIAALFRFYGLAWDSGYLFHPDERKIVLVASGLAWPSTPLALFSPDSPLNPKFFAYGSFPIYLLRGLGMLAPAGPFGVPQREDFFVGLGLLGRVLSALFDLGTISLLFLLGRRLYSAAVGLAAAACAAVAVLHIQLSHFYAVDTLLTFLVILTIFFAARYAESGRDRDLLAMSIGFGLALATKVTAAPLVVAVVVSIARAGRLELQHPDGTVPSASLVAPARAAVRASGLGRWKSRLAAPLRSWAIEVWSTRRALAKFVGPALLVFLVTQPYALLDPIRYFGQVGTEALVARGWLDFPYTRQYAGTVPFIYQILQSTIWGMGLPLGLYAWGGSILFLIQWWRTREWRAGFVLSWALVYFLTIGGQHAKYLRYLLPMLPFLFLMAAASIGPLLTGIRARSSPGLFRLVRIAAISLVPVIAVPTILYALAFVSMYSREHPWLQLSSWIYQHVPSGAAIATEHWDDTLPIPMQIDGAPRGPAEYRIQQMPLYDPDDENKLRTLAETLAGSDYVLLASQRLYTTIPRLPARYPISARYYRLLFGGQLGFQLVAFARHGPMLGNVEIVDDTLDYAGVPTPPLLAAPLQGMTVWDWGHADESYVVYDHPMPLLFRKTRALSPADIESLLNSG